MIEFYLISVALCFIACMLASWYDCEPHYITVNDLAMSIICSVIPFVNIGVAISATFCALNMSGDRVLFGAKK